MANFVFVNASGLIINRVVADDISDCSPGAAVVVPEIDGHPMSIGGIYKDGIYTPPPGPTPLPEMVPQSISDRQFFQQLAVLGIITQDDALASNAAVIPPPLLTIINEMPADKQFNAKMVISGATVFERNNPLTIDIGTAYGWTSAQIDDFFRAAAAL